MPRETIDLRYDVEYLSVLDEDGNLDEELAPSIDDETLVRMHRVMLLSRLFDDRQLSLQRQGKIGTFAPAQGQEASQVGAAAAIGDEDWFVPAFRETTAYLWRGLPMSGMLLFNAGYNEGGRIPEESHDLPIAIPVASQIPYAVGLAYASRYRETEKVVLTFFGDGATSEGDFHESMNFARVFKVPAVFVCQNNQWAISVPREHQTKSRTLAQKALAYGVPGIQVDGNDVFAVYAAVSDAVSRARSGDGPTMVECVTYRLSLHTTADDPSKYRDEAEVEEWRKKDPITRLRNHLIERELLTDEDADDLEGSLSEEIDAAWEETQSMIEELGDPLVMFDHILEEPPPTLEEQRSAFREYLKQSGGND